MKIAIVTEGNSVSGHFGRCESITLVDVENSMVKNRSVISTIGNQHGALPPFLKAHGVQVVIAGGMGEGARQGLISNGIKIIAGISGNIDDVIENYMNGSLKPGAAGCTEHSHGHSHGSGGCKCGHH